MRSAGFQPEQVFLFRPMLFEISGLSYREAFGISHTFEGNTPLEAG
jgi:hypothetical protein